MPKAGIMTFLHNDNYGSILQAYALQRTVRALHLDCEHIDYRPSSREKLINMMCCGNSPALIFEGLRKRSESGQTARAEEIARFCRERLQLSPVCRTHSDLENAAKRYDILIAGSDQIWSPVWLNPAYYLDFAGTVPRIGYACSLGVKTMPSEKKARMIREQVKRFASASVREDEGAAILEAIAGIRCPVMPDPVLLLTEAEWREVASRDADASGRIVCYMIGNNPMYWERVKRTSEVLELKPLIIPMTDESRAKGMEIIEQVSPETFLQLFATASYVMTDSFHGAMFASIFMRQHTILRRYSDEDTESKNSRIDQIQRTFGYISLDACRPDNWTAQRIEGLRRQGTEWLEIAFSLAGV